MTKPFFSLIGAAVRESLYRTFYNSVSWNNNVPFEVIFVGNQPPKTPIADNFYYIYSEASVPQCIEIAARQAKGEYYINSADDILVSKGFLNKYYEYITAVDKDRFLIGCRERKPNTLQLADSGAYWLKESTDSACKAASVLHQQTMKCRCASKELRSLKLPQTTIDDSWCDSCKSNWETIIHIQTSVPYAPLIPFCPAFRADWWHELGGLDKQFVGTCSDFDMVLRYYEKGVSPLVAPECYIIEYKSIETLHAKTGQVGKQLLTELWAPNGVWVKKRSQAVQSFETL